MNLFQRLLLVFIVVPIIEIYLLISVGSVIGVLPTIGLIILTAVIGTYLLRAQGLATVRKLQNTLADGQPPTEALLEGILLLMGGALLLTPGFFTDAIGFACLIPASRQLLARWMSRHVQPVQFQQHPSQRSSRSQHSQTNTTIEGEYRREDDR